MSEREIRILRPYQDDAGRMVPPGETVTVPEPEAESLRIQGTGEVMETHPPRRERAVPPRRERRSP